MSKTREQWLEDAVDLIIGYFADIDAPLPERRIELTQEWPDAIPTWERSNTLGACTEYYTLDVSRVFIAPDLEEDIQVLETLVHELAHAAVGCRHEHGGEFPEVARRIGLAGELTSTSAGPKLLTRLAEMADTLGPYPWMT
jgi:hypothetical protein